MFPLISKANRENRIVRGSTTVWQQRRWVAGLVLSNLFWTRSSLSVSENPIVPFVKLVWDVNEQMGVCKTI